MRYRIKSDIPGRLRVQPDIKRMSILQADTFSWYLQGFACIDDYSVNERAASITVRYSCTREEIIRILKDFDFEQVHAPESFFESSGRADNNRYYERIVTSIVLHYGKLLILPASMRYVIACLKAVRYIWRGLRTIPEKRLKVELLDAAAVTASILTGDHSTAASVMFLLDVGDTLEEWTHKKSVDDLARRMSLNVSTVWRIVDGREVLTDAGDIVPGDSIVIRMGNIIPFDGTVQGGEAMINQASMTGEAIPVHRAAGNTVFAGTVVEEGEITVRVEHISGSGRFDKIVKMIEESERLKSSVESEAERLADRLVPYTFAGAALTYLFTRNLTKAVSVLMVDYSCALKLAMPISVLSAIKEAGDYSITIKGGKFIEAVADADTIVFDKTGTLTKACPVVKEVVSLNGEEPDELLREAACLEEHFPHSIANAVVKAAAEKGLTHDEIHTKVEYIVAHGISTTLEDKKAIIGSYHFVFEDERTELSEENKKRLSEIPEEYSRLYYAKDGKLSGVILIEDPLRPEASDVIKKLHEIGFEHIVMMTGDNDSTASAIAAQVGVDEYHAEVLPEDKASYIRQIKETGRKVIMIGDGINDSPALSEADAGIAVSEGAEIARQIADITIASEDLTGLITLRELSDLLMKRIRFNYRTIVGFNTGLILLGVLGILPPSTSALLHNTSTILLGVKSTTKLLS